MVNTRVGVVVDFVTAQYCFCCSMSTIVRVSSSASIVMSTKVVAEFMSENCSTLAVYRDCSWNVGYSSTLVSHCEECSKIRRVSQSFLRSLECFKFVHIFSPLIGPITTH